MSEIEELKKRIEALERAVKWLLNPRFGVSYTAPVMAGTAGGTCTIQPNGDGTYYKTTNGK